MTQENPWVPFEQIMNDPVGRARSWKERTGGIVIGHLLPDVPEEIIHAFGALPLALEGGTAVTAEVQSHLPPYTCAHAAGLLDLGLRGELDFLDGLVIPYLCDTTRNLFHNWQHCLPERPVHFLRLPKRIDLESSLEFLVDEYRRFIRSLNDLTDKELSLDQLTESIGLYNRTRSILRRAYSLHQQAPGVWTVERLHCTLGAALRVPREELLEWLIELPWECVLDGDATERIPVYVHGKIWNPKKLARVLDDLGFVLVGDDLIDGYRSINLAIRQNGMPPLNALARRFMENILYAGYYQTPIKEIEDFFMRVHATGAKGVIFLNPKFCEPAGFDTPDFATTLNQAGVPYLILETSDQGVPMEQLKIRLEAFAEMLRDLTN